MFEKLEMLEICQKKSNYLVFYQKKKLSLNPFEF